MAQPKKKNKKPLPVDKSTADPTSNALQIFEDVETGNRLLPYATPEGVELDLIFDGEEPWFTQLDLASMYGVDVRTANHHVQEFVKAGELDEATIRKFRIVRDEGGRQVSRDILHYSLDVAFYVGYRVNSDEGKLFRRWATSSLKQLAKYGFVVNKRMLKGKPDRLSQLREIIKDIRSDEATIYAELRRILTMCTDYESSSKASNLFFASFQNKLHYAIVGSTSAEIKLNYADAMKDNMGLQTWDGDQPLQADALVAKNYLGPLHIEDLNHLTTMVLDFFEDQVKRGWIVTMDDTARGLEEILAVNKRHILPDGPRTTKAAGDRHAKAQYKIFDTTRRKERKAKALSDLNDAAKSLPAKKRKAPLKKKPKKAS